MLLSPHALKEYQKLTPSLKPLIQEGIDSLRRSPFAGPKIKRLKGRLRDYYRYRIEDYRIVYTLHPKEKTVYVDYIQHRKDIYRSIG